MRAVVKRDYWDDLPSRHGATYAVSVSIFSSYDAIYIIRLNGSVFSSRSSGAAQAFYPVWKSRASNRCELEEEES